MCFSVPMVGVRMGMFEFEWKWMNAVKSAGNGFLIRGNRFLYVTEPGSHTFFQQGGFGTFQEPVPVCDGTGSQLKFLKNVKL